MSVWVIDMAEFRDFLLGVAAALGALVSMGGALWWLFKPRVTLFVEAIMDTHRQVASNGHSDPNKPTLPDKFADLSTQIEDHRSDTLDRFNSLKEGQSRLGDMFAWLLHRIDGQDKAMDDHLRWAVETERAFLRTVSELQFGVPAPKVPDPPSYNVAGVDSDEDATHGETHI